MLVARIIICIAMVALFIVIRMIRGTESIPWGDTYISWTPLSIILTCVSAILGIILLIITPEWIWLIIPLMAAYFFLLFVSEIEGDDIIYAALLFFMCMFFCLMIFCVE